MERENEQNTSLVSQPVAATEQKEIEELFEKTLERYHGWHDMSARYVYMKEKIIGKVGKKGKKNICHWIETNEIYYGLSQTIKSDRDYWISAGEVIERIKDKSGSPVLREKWLTDMKCHFLILDIEGASRLLGFRFTLSSEQLKELVIEHCRQRGLAVPMMIDDGEELTLLWALETPYYKEEDIYYYDPRLDKYCEDEYTFNRKWTRVQMLLYEDFRYLGVKSDKKHAVTMLRVPGTLNTRTNQRVRLLHEGEETTAEAILRVYTQDVFMWHGGELPEVKHPKLEEYQTSYNEFLKFLEATGEAQPAMKTKRKASKAKKSKVEAKDNPVMEDFAKNINENPTLRIVPMSRWDEYEEYLSQIRQDVLLLHPCGEENVCLCLERNKTWKSIYVKAKDLESELTKLWLMADFRSYNIYDSQAGFVHSGSRKVSNVASVRANYLDLDGKLSEACRDLPPEEWSNKIKEYCAHEGIPQPTIIVFSGNGIHVKWIYKEVIRGDKFRIWQKLEKKLCKLFADLGADSKATDLARVLRIPGTENCKEGTTDRKVRVLSFEPELYDFEEFVKQIEALVPEETKPLEGEVSHEELAELSRTESEEEESFYILNETTGQTDWVKKREMSEYLSRQERSHVLKRSLAEFRGRELKASRTKRVYSNAVQLLGSLVPGATLLEKAEAIRKHRLAYWKGAFCEPTEIIPYKDMLIAVWRYMESDKLPGRALSRWKRTQEDLCEYYADWGAKLNEEYQEVTALLPIAGFTGTEQGAIETKASYTFNTLATGVLPYTQDEVKEYKANKASKARKKRRSRAGKKEESFVTMARRRYKDILHLIELRQDERGEVPEGHRELSVFWGMNSAVQGELVSDVEGFNELTETLIKKCGALFSRECDVSRLGTLRRMFESGQGGYLVKTETLIDELGITPVEQEHLEVLRENPKREKKPRKPTLGELRPWEQEGISERTWYRRRKALKEKTSREKTLKTQMMTEIISRLVRDKYSFGRKLTPFYEGLEGGLEGGLRGALGCDFKKKKIKVIGRILGKKVDVWCGGGNLSPALKRSSQRELQGVAACILWERLYHVSMKTRPCFCEFCEYQTENSMFDILRGLYVQERPPTCTTLC